MTYPTSVWDGDSPNRDRSLAHVKSPNAADWGVITAELIATQNRINDNAGGKDDDALDTNGTLETVTGLSVVEKGDGAVHKTVISFDEVDLDTIDGDTPATDGAWGTLKLYTFPVGHVAVLASHLVTPLAGLEATTGGGTGLSDTADFEIGVGSVASAQTTAFGLEDGTQEDIVAALDADLTGGTSDAIEAAAQATVAVYDGSTTPATLNLNLRTLDDADHGAVADVLKVSGTLTILWSDLGDN